MKTISPIQYMRAHGNSPGPTHRPVATGLISGFTAALPSVAVRYWTGALASEASGLGVSWVTMTAIGIVILAAAGVIYSAIFQRAANDRRGGWLFGISYGFLIWMVGPVTIWQWAMGEPLATGTAAMGLLGAQLVYGLALGGIYPLVNRRTQTRMK